jgi:hypothetical protein
MEIQVSFCKKIMYIYINTLFYSRYSMKHLLIIPCLLLCSCLVQEEAEPENTPLSDPSSFMPSSSSVEPEPSILDCPPEDIAEYPIYEIPDDWDNPPWGGCTPKLKTSKEELSFSAQGGVRCITTDSSFGLYDRQDCTNEEELKGLSFPPSKCWKILKCPSEYPWFTATIVDTRVLHISVNKNETENEREIGIRMSCGGNISITQSAD